MRKSTLPCQMGLVSPAMIVKVMATVAVGAMLAACSNSVERFQTAYKNPSDADPVYTASVPRDVRPAKPRYNYVAPKPYYAKTADDGITESPVVRAPVARAPAASAAQQYDYSQNYTKPYKQTYKPKPVQQDYAADDVAIDDTPATAQRISPSVKSAANNGVVTVGPGMTLYSIARDNNVNPMQLAAANNMKPPYVVWSGQKLHLPDGSEPAAPQRQPRAVVADNTPVAAPVQTKPVFKKAVAGGTTHTVAGGETLYSLGRTYGVSPFVIADANGLSHDQGLHIGQQIKIPGAAKARSQALAQNDAQDSGQIDNADADVTPIAKSPKKKAPLALTEEEQQQADAAAADDGADSIPAVPASKTKTAPFKKAETNQPMPQVPVADGSLNLRWPLRGKVISEFGPKANGLKNEGINIAVPEGTSVRAAEGGVVAYAGNELKGYGNLVLIRHSGGYVTAYAHAKELLVKRGDTVNKGDVIAKAGQTGAVSSPQLHFEVRKGATALDPLKFMTSATAMN